MLCSYLGVISVNHSSHPMQRGCPSVNFLLKSLLLRHKWLDCDQTCTRWSPGERASRVCQGQGRRSRDTGTSVMARKLLLLAGKWPYCDQTCTRWSAVQASVRPRCNSSSRLMVTWYRHFWSHENRFFWWENGWIATKLAQVRMHPGCAEGEGHGHVNYMIAPKSLLLPR